MGMFLELPGREGEGREMQRVRGRETGRRNREVKGQMWET